LDAVLRQRWRGRIAARSRHYDRAEDGLLTLLIKRDLVVFARAHLDERVEHLSCEMVVEGILPAVLEIDRIGVIGFQKDGELHPVRVACRGSHYAKRLVGMYYLVFPERRWGDCLATHQ